MTADVTPEELLGVVQQAVATALEQQPVAIDRDTRLRDDLKADSLTLLEVAVLVEQALDRPGARIEDEDLDGLTTVGDLVDHLAGQL